MFDPKCFELAEYFLATTASQRLKNELAQHIQDEVEVWLSAEANRLMAAMQPDPPVKI